MSLDMNATTPHHHRRRQARGWEYAFYFALVLIISIPTALLRAFLPDRSGRRRFFLVEAWSMARRVTPQIFAV